jgi:carboxyl-terminal processing protease
MSNSTGCKIVITAVVVAIVMGSLGFVTGFLSHAVLVADAPQVASTVVVEVTSTPSPAEEMPTSDASVGTPAEPSATPTPMTPDQSPDEAGATFELFWEAWDLVEQDFFGELPTEEEVTYGAIRGALNTLDDPYTAILEPETAAAERENRGGSFEGIGAYVAMEDGRLTIVSTFEDQPAARAGLRRGDIVLKVDDTPLDNLNIYEAIALIRGPEGTTVRLTVLRDLAEPFEVELVRARIDIPLVESEMREDGLAYAHVLRFHTGATERLVEVLEQLLEEDPKGLILDLRGNPGGWMQEAIDTAGLFLPKDQLVLIERLKDGTEYTFETPAEPIVPDIPMVVLVDRGSASGAEIVAGALQDYGRAPLVGETTFGKGSVWVPHELSTGAELRVTIALWFTPKERAIHGEGLDPDIVVELTQEDFDADLDPQLDRAVEYLLEGQ